MSSIATSQPTIRPAHGGSNAGEIILSVRNLRTVFRTKAGVVRAVDGVDFDIRKGETLCLVGESGSGKSVAARSIMRLIDHPGEIDSSSRLFFDGRDLIAASEADVRALRGRTISMIFQEPMSSLNPVLTVGDQIAEVVALHRMGSASQAMRRAIEMMELVGIPSAQARASDYPHQMSGGMLQRVMIAMALACKPKLVIADEPTTALDVTIQAQILDLLRRLRDEFEMAILLITHDLGVAAEMADEVAVMYAGQIVERGRAEDVLERPQHPYTEALLKSVPYLGVTQAEPLNVIPGMVPSALAWPHGCRFAGRCRHVYDKCTQSPPPLFTAGSQQSRCWLRETATKEAGDSHA